MKCLVPPGLATPPQTPQVNLRGHVTAGGPLCSRERQRREGSERTKRGRGERSLPDPSQIPGSATALSHNGISIGSAILQGLRSWLYLRVMQLPKNSDHYDTMGHCSRIRWPVLDHFYFRHAHFCDRPPNPSHCSPWRRSVRWSQARAIAFCCSMSLFQSPDDLKRSPRSSIKNRSTTHQWLKVCSWRSEWFT